MNNEDWIISIYQMFNRVESGRALIPCIKIQYKVISEVISGVSTIFIYFLLILQPKFIIKLFL